MSKGTKMELPLWLSKGLYEKNRKVLSIELPKVYREGWRTVFNADPNVVDLHKMGPYYYGLGSQMLHFDNPENTEIGQTLLQVCIILLWWFYLNLYCIETQGTLMSIKQHCKPKSRLLLWCTDK